MLSEQQIVAILDGPVLAQYSCVLQRALVRWNPISHMLSWTLDGDDEENKACDDYLTAKGRNFNSIDELVAYASSHAWPGWEKIRGQYEGDYPEGGAML
jgi:hypothetical protein